MCFWYICSQVHVSVHWVLDAESSCKLLVGINAGFACTIQMWSRKNNAENSDKIVTCGTHIVELKKKDTQESQADVNPLANMSCRQCQGCFGDSCFCSRAGSVNAVPTNCSESVSKRQISFAQTCGGKNISWGNNKPVMCTLHFAECRANWKCYEDLETWNY